MPLADLGDVKIYYEEEGKGEAIVLLAGYSCDVSWWHSVASFLKPYFHLILLDYRGGGKSESSKPFTIRDCANDTIKVMDHLKIEKASFVGHSMGGTIAQDVAAFFPDRVKDLFLICSLPKIHPASAFSLHTGLRLREAKIPVDLLIDIGLPWSFSSQFLTDAKKVADFKKFLLSNPNPATLDGLRHRLEALCNFDSRPYLQKIRAKTLVISTGRDFFIPRQDTELLAKHISGAKLIFLQEEGHNPLLECPEKLAKTIHDFTQQSH